MAVPATAVIVVNGGKDPDPYMWIKLCLQKCVDLNDLDGTRYYVWNNNVSDPRVREFASALPGVQVMDADPDEELEHVHAVPLQRLLDRALSDGAEVVTAIDSDAHPVRAGWLRALVDPVLSGADASGVWRDELEPTVEGYLHASCLCTSETFIRETGVRYDRVPGQQDEGVFDTLSEITEQSKARGGQIHKLRRSNVRNYHRLVGGIYGGLVYHHGAGSRSAPVFWDELATDDPAVVREAIRLNQRIGQISTFLLFSEYDSYMNWLVGHEVSDEFGRTMTLLADGDLASKQFARIPGRARGVRGIAASALRKLRGLGGRKDAR